MGNLRNPGHPAAPVTLFRDFAPLILTFAFGF